MELLDYCRNYKKVYIFGDGEIGRLVRIYLHEKGMKVEAFVTTNTPKQSMILDLPVYPLNQLCYENDDSKCFIISVNENAVDIIRDKLLRKGFNQTFVVDNLVKHDLYESVSFEYDYSDVEQEKKLAVLLYHRIGEQNDPYNIVVSKENFESHLMYIKDNYDIIGCGDSLKAKKKKTVALTFDDGYVDFYQNAFPLLLKYQIPATVFISTGNIGNDRGFWWDELEYIIFDKKLPECIEVCGIKVDTKEYYTRKELLLAVRGIILNNNYIDRDESIDDLWKQIGQSRFFIANNRTMNEKEIAEIAKNSLITIGAHTVSHVICCKESNDELVHQIQESKNHLEDIIKKEVDLFAYPNGDFDNKSIEALRQIGFKRAFTCIHACVNDENKEYEIPRFGISNWEGKDVRKGFRSIWMTDRGRY